MHSHPILAGSSLLLPSVPRETEPTRRAFRSQVPPSSLIRTALTLEAGAREAKELPVESTGEARATRLPAIPSPLLLSNPVRRRESGGSFSTAGSSPASQSEAKASSRPTVESKARQVPPALAEVSFQLFSVKVHLQLHTWKAVGGQTPPAPPTRATGATSYISAERLVLDSSFQLHPLPGNFPTARPRFSLDPHPQP